MQGTTEQEAAWPSPGRAWYAVGVLLVAVIFSFVDRIILTLLVGPLRRDLALSDTEIGVLQGLAFAVFYALVGLPIGRWADRHSRRAIIGWGVFLWSIMTAVCGLARNFWELFAARVGVGVGEAALGPAAYSMISDLFPRARLGRAVGVYQSGAFLGSGLAFLLGGLVFKLAGSSAAVVLPVIGEVQPWQAVFFAVGLPGVLVALLLRTVPEPVRRGRAPAQGDALPLAAAVAHARRNWRVFASHFVGFALLAVPITTILTWSSPLYQRVFHYTIPEVGLRLGAVLVVLSPAGVYAGGWLTDLLQRRGHADAMYRVGILAAVILTPLAWVATRVSSPQLALALFCPLVFFASLSMAVAPAALQVAAPNQMRAQFSAVWMLFLNVITAGVGPTAVGLLTDRLYQDPLAVGSAMALLNGISAPLAGLVLWWGLRSFRALAGGPPR